jgi:hypothetical protein
MKFTLKLLLSTRSTRTLCNYAIIRGLEYAVVAGLSVFVLVSMLVYFRCKKRRGD